MREYKRRGQEENINVKQAPTTRNDESVLTETQGMVIKAGMTNVHNEKQSLNSSRGVEEFTWAKSCRETKQTKRKG